MKSIYVTQDGLQLTVEIQKLFEQELEDNDFSSVGGVKYVSFVGFIKLHDIVLVSFPKNYFSSSELRQLKQGAVISLSDLRALSRCLYKAGSVVGESSSLRLRDEINRLYPFEAFRNIFHYYQAYGLFMASNSRKKYGFSGRISWPDTIRSSSKVIVNGQLLYLPFVIKSSKKELVFVSQCMVYAINSTLKKFPYLFDHSLLSFEANGIKNISNSHIVRKLKDALHTTFKDTDQKLIRSLIVFFKFTENQTGTVKFKTNNFNIAWEKMVKELIVKRFVEVDRVSGEIIWSDRLLLNKIHNEGIYTDRRAGYESTYRIEPDYYFVRENGRYILDAKYYSAINRLDYKQISYYFLLKDHLPNSEEAGNPITFTHNALILPTHEQSHTKLHFDLNPSFNKSEDKFQIYAHFLNLKDVMKRYINQ